MNAAQKFELLDSIVRRFTTYGEVPGMDSLTAFVIDHIRDGRPQWEKHEIGRMCAPLMPPRREPRFDEIPF